MPTKVEREKFLAALAQAWSITKAAQEAGVAFQRFYELRADDPEGFGAEWAEAYEQGTQRLEDEMIRRGVDGYDEETRDADGNLLRSVHRWDSNLLDRALKARRPEVYRDNAAIELNTGPVTLQLEPDAERTLRVLEKLREAGLLTAVPEVIEGTARELPSGSDDKEES